MCCHFFVSVTVTMVVDLDVGMCRREKETGRESQWDVQSI